jgi:uncharacterized peroxidase-related enzyme
MSRISAIDPTTATGKTKEILDAVKKGLGATPNLFRVTARSAAALEGMVTFHGAIQHGSLDARLREAIALAVAEVDGCDYCLSAHAFLGKRAGLSEDDVEKARDGSAADPRLAAAVRFARAVASQRGHVGDAEIDLVRRAGFSDGEIIEIIANVAWSVFTNYVNVVAETEIDFSPIVRRRS